MAMCLKAGLDIIKANKEHFLKFIWIKKPDSGLKNASFQRATQSTFALN